MKKFLSLILVTLMLCALLTCASAKTVTGSETFTSPSEDARPYQDEQEHFLLNCEINNPGMGGLGVTPHFSLTSKDDTVIDRVEFVITAEEWGWDSAVFDNGTKGSENGICFLDDVNSTSVREITADTPFFVSSITVYYQTEVPDPVPAAPKTGDGAHPALWLALIAAGIAGIAAAKRRARG